MALTRWDESQEPILPGRDLARRSGGGVLPMAGAPVSGPHRALEEGGDGVQSGCTGTGERARVPETSS